MQVHAEKSPFLTERLKVVVLPTLALIKHEKVMDYIVGFDPLGGTDDFSTGKAVEFNALESASAQRGSTRERHCSFL